jgi:hypothetical protein
VKEYSMSKNDQDLGKSVQDLIRNLTSELDKNLGSYGDFFKNSSKVFEDLQKEVAKLADNEELLDGLADIEVPEELIENPDFGEYSEENKEALEALAPDTLEKISNLEKQGEILFKKLGAVDGVIKVLESAEKDFSESNSEQPDLDSEPSS